MINGFLSLGNELFIRDFSLGIGLPVIGIARKVNESECVVTIGVASHPEEALVRALIENPQIEGNPELMRDICKSEHYFADAKVKSIDEMPVVEDKDIKVEIERIARLLDKRNMKIIFIDTTDSALRIPSVFTFITNSLHLTNVSRYRNILMTLIYELLETDNIVDAERFVELGERIDRQNRHIYTYFKGHVLMQRREYHSAVNCRPYSSTHSRVM